MVQNIRARKILHCCGLKSMTDKSSAVVKRSFVLTYRSSLPLFARGVVRGYLSYVFVEMQKAKAILTSNLDYLMPLKDPGRSDGSMEARYKALGAMTAAKASKKDRYTPESQTFLLINLGQQFDVPLC